jgi:hypothetical protein
MRLSTIFILGLMTALFFTSCEETPVETPSYNIPDTYNFANVYFQGQTDRLNKMGEITTYIKTAHSFDSTNSNALDAAKIKDMYDANSGQYFTDALLNASTKKLKNKTISTEVSNFENYMDQVAAVSLNTNQVAANGQAGIATKNSGDSYLLNANGIELTQIIEKGLMGACFYYQATAVYMGSTKMDVDNEIVVPNEGTDMEHHWDEAFGYFGVSTTFPTTTSGLLFWGKYCNKHELTYPLNDKMMDAFLKGRAAISAKDEVTRDEQIAELRKNWELVVAATAIYYLNKSKDKLTTDPVSSYHGLSEGFAFIMSLKYGAGTGSITEANVNTILTDLFGSSDPLQANNYNVTEAKIEAAKTALVSYFTDLASVKDTL